MLTACGQFLETPDNDSASQLVGIETAPLEATTEISAIEGTTDISVDGSIETPGEIATEESASRLSHEADTEATQEPEISYIKPEGMTLET